MEEKKIKGVLDPEVRATTAALMAIAIKGFLDVVDEDDVQMAAYITGLRTGAAAILHATGVDLFQDISWKELLNPDMSVNKFIEALGTFAPKKSEGQEEASHHIN